MSDGGRRRVAGGQVREIGVMTPGLQAQRGKQLLTQTELAAKAGVSRATVANAERGARVGLASVEKLAKALGVNIDVLTAAPAEE